MTEIGLHLMLLFPGPPYSYPVFLMYRPVFQNNINDDRCSHQGSYRI